MNRMLLRNVLSGLFMLIILISCGSQSSVEKYREDLKTFNNSVLKIVDNFDVISQKNGELNDLLIAEDLDGYGMNISLINSLLDEIVNELDKLQKVTDAIEDENDSVPVAELKIEPVTMVGAALVVAGLAAFGKKCKDLAKNATDQWKKTSDTLADVSDDKATEEDYKAEKNKLIETNQEFGYELSSRIITANLPGNPKNLGTLILKEVVTDQVQEGVKTIFATKKCNDDMQSIFCKVGATVSNTEGKVPVFAEKSDIVIVKDGNARVVVEDVTVATGAEKEITRAEVPVEDATPEIVTQNDDGTYDPTKTDVEGEGTTILCYTFVDGNGHYACLKYNGSYTDLQNENFSNATAQCLNADYKQYRAYFETDLACRKECKAKAGEYGNIKCDTP
ncbi:MAG TPA: hypothetical protein PLB16_09235 [bacterium]|nr:hypothetical protein [bacterium]